MFVWLQDCLWTENSTDCPLAPGSVGRHWIFISLFRTRGNAVGDNRAGVELRRASCEATCHELFLRLKRCHQFNRPGAFISFSRNKRAGILLHMPVMRRVMRAAPLITDGRSFHCVQQTIMTPPPPPQAQTVSLFSSQGLQH